jgi:DnaK suppressor protein
MDKEILEKLTTQLTKQKEKLEKELSEVASKDPHNESNYEATFPDFGDEEEQNANEVGQFTTNLELEKILTSSLRDVNKALERITEGKYGVCKYCGEEINHKRLEARPASSACVACKTKLTQER